MAKVHHGSSANIDPNPVYCLGTDRAEQIRASFKRLETGSDILHTPNFHRYHREAERAGRCLNLTHVPQSDRIAGIGQNRYRRRAGTTSLVGR